MAFLLLLLLFKERNLEGPDLDRQTRLVNVEHTYGFFSLEKVAAQLQEWKTRDSNIEHSSILLCFGW